MTSLDTVLVGTSSSDIDVAAATVAYLALLGRGLVENQPRPVGVVRAGVLVAVLGGSHCRSSVVGQRHVALEARKGYRLRRLRHETLIEVSAGLGLELGRGVGEQQHGYGSRFGGRCAVLGPIVNRSMLVLVLLLVLVPKVLLLLVVLVLKVLLLLLKVLLKVLLRLNVLLSVEEVELLLVLLVLELLLVRGGDERSGGVLLALEGLLPLHLSFAVGRQGEGKGRWVNDKLWLSE